MSGSAIWVRVGGTCGMAAVVLFLVGVFAGGTPPGIGATGKDVLAYYGRGGARVSNVAAILIVAFAPWFLTTLTLMLWARPAARAYAAIGLAAGVLALAVFAADIAVRLALVYGQLDENVAHAFNVARQTFGTGVRLGFLSATLGYGLALAQLPGPWRWAGYLAFLVALLEAIAVLASFGTGSAGILALFGALAFQLWVALTGVLQVWRGPELARESVPA